MLPVLLLSVETDYQAPDLKGFVSSILKSIFPTLRFVNGICLDCLAGSNNFFVGLEVMLTLLLLMKSIQFIQWDRNHFIHLQSLIQ